MLVLEVGMKVFVRIYVARFFVFILFFFRIFYVSCCWNIDCVKSKIVILK